MSLRVEGNEKATRRQREGRDSMSLSHPTSRPGYLFYYSIPKFLARFLALYLFFTSSSSFLSSFLFLSSLSSSLASLAFTNLQ